MKKILLFRSALVAILGPLWIFLRSVYRDRITSFGCFDDCFNFMGGYFLLAGKHLYSEIFFNHQPFMAYISAFIQYIGKPDSILMLLYGHRMLLIWYFIFADVMLILRFGWVGFAFSVLYETTKGYIFGERFLAESIIVYPIVYLLGLVWERFHGKPVRGVELVLAGILSWLIVFLREPYVPLAVLMLGTLFFMEKKNQWSYISLAVFLFLSVATVSIHSIGDYVYQVVTVNREISLMDTYESSWGTQLSRILFYPVYLISGQGNWNHFRLVETLVVVLFLGSFMLAKKKLSSKLMAWLFIVLALANIRPLKNTGDILFGAFHHIQWYAIAIAVTLFHIDGHKRWYKAILAGGFFIICAVALLSPGSLLYERTDRTAEFIVNYDQYVVTGDVVRLLSDPGDTLFLDEWDDLIYWQAKRYSPYKYSWFTSVMPRYESFTKARLDMFAQSPPDFYYGKCPKDVIYATTIPDFVKDEYIQLDRYGEPSCVYVHRTKFPEISDDQWDAIKRFEYTAPEQVIVQVEKM